MKQPRLCRCDVVMLEKGLCDGLAGAVYWLEEQEDEQRRRREPETTNNVVLIVPIMY